MEEGINPGREVPEFLCEHTTFKSLPAALGSLEYHRYLDGSTVQTCVGTLSAAVPNANAGWHYTVDQLGLFFEHTLAIPQDDPRSRDLVPPNLWAAPDPAPPIVGELLGNYLDNIRNLARRSSEMHIALSSQPDVTDFAPEPFTTFYRQSVYHGMLGQLNRTFELLRARARSLPPEGQTELSEVLSREGELRAQLLALRDKRMSGMRIRNHGDYHLSNVLFTGSDWVLTNFEGDPGRPLSERRIKRSALRDVATMLRSFHYVSHAALFGDVPGIVPSREAHPQLERWARVWYHWVSAVFLKEYFRCCANASFLPQQVDETKILLAAYMIERALIELEYELEQRPAWIRIPLHGILEQMAEVNA